MLEAEATFWSWLAEQSAFTQVGFGVVFIFVIAPAFFALVVAAVLKIEQTVEALLTAENRPAIRNSAWMWVDRAWTCAHRIVDHIGEVSRSLPGAPAAASQPQDVP